jgi:hypothetical protein
VRGQQSLEISTTAKRVYGVVSELTRMGELSPECRRVEWLDGATRPTRGARSVGHNRGGPVTWSREGRVVATEPGTEFSFTTEWRGHDSTAWTYRMALTTSGTTVTEFYDAIWPPWWRHVLDAVTFRHTQLARHMSVALDRLKKIVESTPANESTP